MELRRLFAEAERKNYDPTRTPSFLGGGLYDHDIPAVVRHMTLRSEFYTAYTPYQAEVAQGTLMTIFEFQSMVCELTGHGRRQCFDVRRRLRGRRGGAPCCERHRTASDPGRRDPSTRTIGRSSKPTDFPPVSSSSNVGGDGPLTAARSRAAPRPDRGGRAGAAAELLRAGRGSRAPRRGGARGRIAPDRFRRSRRPRYPRGAGAPGSGYRGGRGTASRKRPELRRSGLRPLRVQEGADPPSPRTSGCRDRRCGRAARLRADAADARAAHPSREGDLEHLHEQQPRGAGLHDHPRDAGARRDCSEMANLCLQKAHYLEAKLAAIPGVRRDPQGSFFLEFALRLPRKAKDVIDAIYHGCGDPRGDRPRPDRTRPGATGFSSR